MADEQTNGADVDLSIAGQQVKLKNIKSLNTLATVTTLICVILIGYVVWMHTNDDKEAKKELSMAIRELTQSAREQNCLISMPIDQRNPDICRRISR